MIQRDYFIRIIEEFTAALARFMKKKDDDRKDDDLRDLYRQYVGSYDVLRNLSLDETLAYSYDQWPDNERLDRLDMLAELLYAEGSYKSNPLRAMLLGKAYYLFDYIEANGTTLSLTRQQRMRSILETIKTPHGQHQ